MTNFLATCSVTLLALVSFFPAEGASATYSKEPPDGGSGQQPSIVGTWNYEGGGGRIVSQFREDGTFHEESTSENGKSVFDGQYRINGQLLLLQSGDIRQQAFFRFTGTDTAIVTYPDGTIIEVHRAGHPSSFTQTSSTSKSASKFSLGGQATPSQPANEVSGRSQASVGARLQPAPANLPDRLLLRRVDEPNEKGFSVLVPENWEIKGGVFNVHPDQTNGPANSITPKYDFAVMNTPSGEVMVHWIPTWNYADLSTAPSNGILQPGAHYQGMPVRSFCSPEAFLRDLLARERPTATDVSVLDRDPLAEIDRAYEERFASVNQSLVQMNLAPVRFESLALLIEYTENNTRFREVLKTTLVDNRSGAFMWSNEQTLLFRAPSESFEEWKPIIDRIRSSFEFNPQWIAKVQLHAGVRGANALETQRHINNVFRQIAANQSRNQAEIRHENWLTLSGQDEYNNPFTGEIERDTSAYRFRWQNDAGEIIYSNEASFDPNRFEAYNSKEWKPSTVWDRKP